MSFDPGKCRIGNDRSVQNPSENFFDFSCDSDLLDINRGQFFPVAVLKIIGDKESIIIDSFAWFLAAQSDVDVLLGRRTVALDDVVVSEWTEDFAPKSALDAGFLLCDFVYLALDQLVGALAEGDACNLQFLGLFDEVSYKTVDFLSLLLGFGSEDWSGSVFGYMSVMIWFCLLDNVGEFDQIEILEVVILNETEDVRKVGNNFRIVENGMSFNGLLQVFSWESNRK